MEDSVLLAVNLLAIFENITGSQKTFDAWHNHIEGAAALLQHRGIQQFETAEGGRLFMRTAMCLSVSCIGRRYAIPAHILQLAAHAEEHMPLPKDKIWLFFRLDLLFASLYAKLLPDNIVPCTEDAETIFKETLMLDLDMDVLLRDFSEDWYFDTISTTGPTVFENTMHVYPHFTIAQQCNSMRWTRIILRDIMSKALNTCGAHQSLHLSVAETSKILNSRSTIRQLQLDILASVPQHLSTSFLEMSFFSPSSTISPDGVPRDRLWTNFAIKDQNPWRYMKRQSPSLPLVRISDTYTFQWALYIAGSADAPESEARGWVIKMLRLLSEQKDLQQALLLAKSLEMNEGVQLNAHLKYTAGDET